MTYHRRSFRRLTQRIAAAVVAALASISLLAPASAHARHAVPARYQPAPDSRVPTPEWARTAIIYQINTRQFTPEGTFRAAQAQLPRLKALGVDILWLMPVHPIGEKNRKGSLGSPYAVRDYYGVNPEFGTKDDLKSFIRAAHAQGFHVILDWVANHTAWDNPLATQHADWYAKNWDGNFRPTTWFDWSDIIDLDYTKAEVRQYMTNAMTHWVREYDIDGFRCDVAGMVPVDFWNNVRKELNGIKPVFMLAEWEWPELHRDAFDASYAWGWGDALHKIAHGQADVGALFGWLSWDDGAWPHAAMRMTGTSNHDKNAWEGTEYELFGPAENNVTVLAFVTRGIPMIYNGQEAGNAKRLAFFEKDPIVWRDHPNRERYQRLIAFRDAHPALHNGRWGGPMIPIVNTAHPHVFSFARIKDADKIVGLFNMSAQPQRFRLTDGPYAGRYRDYRDNSIVIITNETTITLPPWSYQLLSAAP